MKYNIREERYFFGNGIVSQIEPLLKQLNVKKVFLVTGKASFRSLHNLSSIETALKGVSVYHYFDFEVNPNLKDVLKGIDLVNDFKPDVILSIGGGSVIDTGKLLSVLPCSEQQTTEIIISGQVPNSPKIPLIVVPTTAGSGSESTHFAVMYIENDKYSLASPKLFPDYCFIDPVCTWSMSPKLTAISAIDALSQAIESYWAVSSTVESRQYAEQSLKLNLEVFEKVVSAPDSLSREIMMMASNLAGKAINITKTTAVHAFSYFLTKKYDIPHGQAVGMLLPVFMAYNNSSTATTLIDRAIHRERMQSLCQIMNFSNIEEAITSIKELIKKGGIYLSFSDLGMSKPTDFEEFFKRVNLQRLGNHPVEVKRDILDYILDITI